MKVFNTTPRDIGFWLRSARTDAALARFRRRHDHKQAFDLLYQCRPDPWGSGLFRGGYQGRKYDALVSFLPQRHYTRALDLGCGLGVLTRRLAPHADRILGLDLSTVAVRQAQERSAGYSNLDFACADLLALDASLDGRFDLVVVADTLYYLSPLTDELLKDVAYRISRLLSSGGICLLANHFFFEFDPDSRLSRRIHTAFRWMPGLRLLSEHRHAFYLATLLERRG